MTESQKAQILKLRADGMSYGEIACNIGLRHNTVKSYCRRKFNGHGSTKIKKPKEITASAGYCQECGKPLRQIHGRKLKEMVERASRNGTAEERS